MSKMANYFGGDYVKHRTAGAQASCNPAGSSDSSDQRTEPLLITGNKIKDATLGEPRITAGEIVGWRIWKLCDGLLRSIIVPYIWQPGVFEGSSCKQRGYDNVACYENVGYHAFKVKERRAEAHMYTHWWPSIIGSVAMWGEVIEHENGWRSEYAAVR